MSTSARVPMTRRLFPIFRAAALVVAGAVLGFLLSDPIKDAKLMLWPAPTESSASEAWHDFTQRIDALGNRILEDDFPSQTDGDRAQGIRQLAHMIVEGLRWEFEHGDPEFTGLMISNTDTTGWGGPNVDNKYHRARIDGTSTYILTGNVEHLHEIAIQTNKGDMHMGQIGTSETFDLSKLAVDADGNFTVRISPDPQEGDWIQQGADHTILSIRAFYVNWAARDHPEFYLVKDGNQGVPPEPLSEAMAATRLGNAAHWIEASLVGWNNWLRLAVLNGNDNAAMEPRTVDGGSSTLLYGGVPYSVDPDMALVIEVDDPQASYFSFQTYGYGWFDAGDYANHQTSINSAQAHKDTDGKFRFIASAQDPGVPNWIDLEDRARGLIVFRYMNAQNPQQPSVTLTSHSEVRKHLPQDTPTVSERERREEISVRQQHVRWRFHN